MDDPVEAAASPPAAARRMWAALVLLVAAGALAPGVLLPVIKLKHFFLWSDTYSLAGMVAALFTGGEIFLALVIAVFSILLPALKIAVIAMFMLRAPSGPAARFVNMAAGHLGKWSLLDVVLVALIIFAVKTGGLGSAMSQPGLYFFTLSVAATALAAGLAAGVIAQKSDV